MNDLLLHLTAAVQTRLAELREYRRDDSGATAIEYAVLATVVLGVATLLGAAVKLFVDGKINLLR